MGELLCPLPGAGLSGRSLPREASGGTTPVAVASSGNVYSAPTVTPEQSICRAWRLWGGAADLLSSGQERPCCPGPPGLFLSRGRLNPGLCPGALCSRACPVGFSLPAAKPPHRRATAQAPPSCSWSPAAPSTRSLFLCRRRRHQAAPGAMQTAPHKATAQAPQSWSGVNACALQPLRSSVHSSGSAVSVSVPGSPRASPLSWGPSLTP